MAKHSTRWGMVLLPSYCGIPRFRESLAAGMRLDINGILVLVANDSWIYKLCIMQVVRAEDLSSACDHVLADAIEGTVSLMMTSTSTASRGCEEDSSVYLGFPVGESATLLGWWYLSLMVGDSRPSEIRLSWFHSKIDCASSWQSATPPSFGGNDRKHITLARPC